MSHREKRAYQVAWRHVGFYLGITPSLLTRYYGRTFETTESSFASLAYAIFPSGEPPADPYTTPQYKILSAVAARPPRGKRVEHHLELCRLCIGPSLAAQLAIPRGSWRDVWTVETERLMSWGLLMFGDAYSRFGGARGKRWESRRRDWFRWVVKLLVIWQLGEKRTVFAWRDEARHGDKLGLEEGEDAVSFRSSYSSGLKLGLSVSTGAVMTGPANGTHRGEACEEGMDELAGRVGACARRRCRRGSSRSRLVHIEGAVNCLLRLRLVALRSSFVVEFDNT